MTHLSNRRTVRFSISLALAYLGGACYAQDLGPEQQRLFCKGIEEVQTGYNGMISEMGEVNPYGSRTPPKAAPKPGNPIQEARQPPAPAPPKGPFQFDKLVAAMGDQVAHDKMGVFENWRGRVKFSVENGRVQIRFFPNCGFKQPEPDEKFTGFRNALVFETQWWGWNKLVQTSPPLSSPVAEVLSHLDQGAAVVVSGNLVWINNPKKLTWITVGGQRVDTHAFYAVSPDPSHYSEGQPGFVASFTSVKSLK